MLRFPISKISARLAAATLAAASIAAVAARAQTAPPSRQNPPADVAQANAPQTPAALNASDAVPDGTRFLVRLDDELNTAKDNVNRKFSVTVIEPLETAGGAVLPPGCKITGHIVRIQSAEQTGRARLWLAFDDIKMPGGKTPIVAEVSGVPEDGSVKPDPGKEGEIEARQSSAAQQAEVAAAGAVVGAAVGGAAAGGRGVAEGAIAGGATAFLISRHYAQEIDLRKGARLELVLDRPLFVTQP